MNCLQWFTSLIVDKEVNVLKEDFKAYAKEMGGYFMPAPPDFIQYDESKFYVDIEQGDNLSTSVNSFDQYVSERIEKESSKSIICLKSEISKLDGAEITTIISRLENDLNTLIYLNSLTDLLNKKKKLNLH